MALVKLYRETISFPQTPKDQFRMLYLYYLCSPPFNCTSPPISMANYRSPINTIIDRSIEERCSQHIPWLLIRCPKKIMFSSCMLPCLMLVLLWLSDLAWWRHLQRDPPSAHRQRAVNWLLSKLLSDSTLITILLLFKCKAQYGN